MYNLVGEFVAQGKSKLGIFILLRRMYKCGAITEEEYSVNMKDVFSH